MSLRIRFWGTRGSIPSPGPHTVRYGGNTPCVEMRTSGDRLVILDAGTGIRALGKELITRAAGAPIEANIFLTHTHWDHIQGLPFFAPLFQTGNQFTIWGSKTLEAGVDRVVHEQMSTRVFPVPFESVGASIGFRHMEAERCQEDGFEVSAIQVRHPGGALGYRFRDGNGSGGAFVYISDNELGDAPAYATPPGWREELLEFARGASVLVHDTMYTSEEYEHHGGWGHSTYDEVVDLALDAGVERVVLFHHSPERTDDEVDQRVEECRARVRSRNGRLEVMAAAEGTTLTV